MADVELRADPAASGQLRKVAASVVDPHGQLYDDGDRMIRAISASSRDFVDTLLADPVVQAAQADGRLVQANRVPAGSLGFPEDQLLLAHPKVNPVTFPAEWAPSMLKDAAELTLNLLHDLNERDMSLQDAHPWNILYDGSSPVLVDFTSIVPAPEHILWAAHSQYVSHFRNPLILHDRKLHAAAMAGLLNPIRGVDGTLVLEALGNWPALRAPGIAIPGVLDSFIQKRPALKAKIREMAANVQVTRDQRRSFIRREQKKLSALLKQTTAPDVWSGYYSEIPPTVDKSKKVEAIGELLQRIKPGTVVDVGCNTGVFSLQAAELGARVVSLDYSVPCIESLYIHSRDNGLPVTPLVVDLAAPTPAHGFLNNQYPALFDRIEGECVFCLGLMHHLHLALRQSFENIGTALARLSSKYCIFEYVDVADDNIDLIGSRQDVSYTLESALEAFSPHFQVEQVIESDRPTRQLVLLRKTGN